VIVMPQLGSMGPTPLLFVHHVHFARLLLLLPHAQQLLITAAVAAAAAHYCCCCCRHNHKLHHRSITSLYIGGVTSDISEEDLRGVFYPYGALAGVRKVASRFCAFVQFAERSGAEAAAEALHNRLTVKGVRLRMMWGRPQPPRESGGGPGAGGRPGDEAMQPVQSSRGGGAGSMAVAAAPAGTVPPPDYFGLAPPTLTSGPSQYPSMDPTAMGARLPKRVSGDDGEGSGSKRSKAGGDGDGAAGSFGGDRLSGFGAFAAPSTAAVPAEAPAPAAS
jgi:RNA recognition motif. (a.k.a. RRM, RBD, or RNP domain)